MAEPSSVHRNRSRPWWVDVLAGAGLAFALFTAAQAALARIESRPAAERPRPAAPAARAGAAAPAEPPALISFQSPTPGYPVISPFGLRQLPWEEAGRLHAGVDIAAPPGQPVVAAADGVVTRIAVDPGYGRFVELKHAEGLSTVYAHLGRVAPEIASGVAVKAGGTVGEVGSTGTSTGAHVHFEVRDTRERPLNPELFLGRRFAAASDLPLRAAARIPRQVRVAYVSNIPKAKREQMAARREAETILAAEDAAVDAAASVPTIRLPADRPHARFQIRRSGATGASTPEPGRPISLAGSIDGAEAF